LISFANISLNSSKYSAILSDGFSSAVAFVVVYSPVIEELNKNRKLMDAINGPRPKKA